MTNLITRIEQADGPRRELFEEAFFLLFPAPSWKFRWRLNFTPEERLWDRKWQRLSSLLRCHAWTSAAEMLVPDDWPRSTEDYRGLLGMQANATITANPVGQIKKFAGRAAHPSLALLAAILRAERNEP